MTATQLFIGIGIVLVLVVIWLLAQGIGEAFGHGVREYLVR